MAAINFPTATSNGQTFEADTGVIYTYVGSPPNGFWSATFATTGLTTLDNRYIAKNDGNSIQTMQTQGLKFNNGTADTILLDGVNGKVGIGTASPLAGSKLTVAGNALAVTGQNTAHSANSIRIGEEGSGAAEIRCYGPDASTNGSLRLRVSRSDGSNSQDVLIDSSGNVGIGTTAPNRPLTVASAAGSTNILGVFDNRTTSATNCVIAFSDPTSTAGQFSTRLGSVGDSLAFYTNGANERMRINSSGSVGIGDTAPSEKLNVAGNIMLEGSDQYLYLTNAGTSNSGIYIRGRTSASELRSHSTGIFTWEITGNEKMRIDSSGRVGIGATSPRRRLEIAAGGTASILLTSTTANANKKTWEIMSTDNASSEADLVFKSRNDNSGASGGIEAIRIDSSGKLLVGTSTARSNFYNSTNSPHIQLEGSGSNSNYTLSVVSNYAGNSLGAQLILAKSGSASVGGNTLVSDGNTIGVVNFQGADGSHFIECAKIAAVIDGTPGTDDMPGRLEFFTTGDGSAGSTERMRIDSSGRVGINVYGNTGAALQVDHVSGTTGLGSPVIKCGSSTSWAGNGTVYSMGFGYTSGASIKSPAEIGLVTTSSGAFTKGDLVFATRDVTTSTTPTERMRLTSDGDLAISKVSYVSRSTHGHYFDEAGWAHHSVNNDGPLWLNRSGNFGAMITFSHGGTDKGTITVNSSAPTVSYNTSSDYRLKENLVSLTGAISRIKSLPVYRFNFISVPGATVDGFLAHEAQTVVPEAVTGTKDETKEEEYEVTPAVVNDDGEETTPAVMETRTVPVMQGIDQAKVVPLLTAALQETIAKVETLESGEIAPFTVKQSTSLLNNSFASFLNSNGDTAGAIIQNGINSVTYATSSDYRLKDNVVDLSAAIPRLKQLAPKRFNFKDDADVTVDGFLAHEAQIVVPEAVTGTHNQLDGDGNAVYQGIDQSKLVPLLTAALQEAIGRIETLETEVAALKGG